jgi:Na+/H+ antiporter NhaD/arsenite permease-like protein
MGVLIFVKITLVFIAPRINLELTWISLASAFPVLLFSRRRFEIIKHLDWTTFLFFISMFVLMASVWDSGVFQSITENLHLNLSDRGVILSMSVILSQFISNVPMVALYLPVLDQSGAATDLYMALAAGSTIAGNLTILGAASNVIIVQNCESRSCETVTFWEFIRIGLPLTLVQISVYWIFLNIGL